MEEVNMDEEPPSKRLKTQHMEEPPSYEEALNELRTVDSDSVDCIIQNSTDDYSGFDPVQAILDAGISDFASQPDNEDNSSMNKEDSKNLSNNENDSTVVESVIDEFLVTNDNSNDSVSSDKEIPDTNEKETERAESPEVQVIKTMKKTGGRSKKSSHMRKNIKDILKPDQLDEETIAAQREEAERRIRMEMKQLQLRQLQQLQLQQQQLIQQSMPYLSQNSKGPSVDQILRHISKTSTSVSLVPPEPIFDDQYSRNRGSGDDDVTILSSDDEVENVNTNFSPLPRRDRPLFRNFGGTVITSCERDDNVIALSSEDEESSRHKSSRLPVPDSDDDCVVISPPPPGDADVGDEEEKNLDELNVPDKFGRILINVAHREGEPDVFLAPQVAKIIKPHQIGGIRFLYDNVVESIDRFNTSSGFGCILAHSMGLGKTVQAVSFCDVFLRYTKAKNVLVIVPINTIQNWMNEFNQWVPSAEKLKLKNMLQKNSTENAGTATNSKSNSSKNKQEVTAEASEESPKPADNSNNHFQLDFDDLLNEDEDILLKSEGEKVIPEESTKMDDPDNDIRVRNFNIFVLNETVKTLQAREKIITEWGETRGVLLIGYEMYRMLSLKKLKKSGRKNAFPNNSNLEAQEESLNRIYSYLVNPGPDLVICDEGHRIKNSGASISQALKAIKTKRRVVLTGYPLQNNLMEYWCMVDFVRPNYLGTKVEFSNMFERPIQNGQCADSNVEDKRLMRFRSHVLHSLLEGFVQRRSHVVLQNALPAKQEWVFLLKMSPIQKSLYTSFITYLNEGLEAQNTTANPIKAFAVCCKIWNHPDALYNVVRKKQSLLDDLDLEEINAERGVRKGRGSKKASTVNESPSPTPIPDYFMGYTGPTSSSISSRANTSAYRMMENNSLSLDWALPLFENYVPELLENGVKFKLLFDILQETVDVGDKLLVFSQSLLSLDLIEMFLSQKFQWKKNTQYFRLDGSTTGLEREKLINEFNVREGLHLFLVSTRAGSLGINLIGANRVIVMDASWNPCHDCQAVCRVYRYGQKKQCQIYRFVTDLSLEKRIYDRQVNKRGMADRVVDEMNPDSHFRSKDVNSFLVLHHEHLEKLQYIKCNINPEKYSDLVLKRVLSNEGFSSLLTKEPFEHESLLIDQKSQKLSKAEKRLAHRNYEKEKKISNSTQGNLSSMSHQRASYAAFYPKTPPNYSMPTNYPPHPYGSFGGRSPYDKPMSYYGRYHYSENASAPSNSDERAIEALRERGICVQYLILKKDGFLSDPAGGPDMYLPAGQKVYVLRSAKGTYIRLESGKIIAVRTASNNLHFTANIPPSQDLTPEQLQTVVYSLVKVPGHSGYGRKKYPVGYSPSHSHHYHSPQHSSSYPPPPTEQPLPPSNFLHHGQNHLQIKSYHTNSGGDVTVWKPESNPNSNSNNSSDGQRANDSPASMVAEKSSTNAEMRPGISSKDADSFNYIKNLAGNYDGTTEFQNPFSGFLSDLSIGKHDSNSSSNNATAPATDSQDTFAHLEQLLNQTNQRNFSSGIELIPIPSKNRNQNNSNSKGSHLSITEEYLDPGWSSKTSNPQSNSIDSSFFNDFTITPVKKDKTKTGDAGGSGSRNGMSPVASSLKSTFPWENGGGRFPTFPGRSKSNGSKPHESGNVDWLSDDFENPLFANVTSASSNPSTSASQYSDNRRAYSTEQGEATSSTSTSSISGCNSIRALLERRDTASSYYNSSRRSGSRRNSFGLEHTPTSTTSPLHPTPQ